LILCAKLHLAHYQSKRRKNYMSVENPFEKNDNPTPEEIKEFRNKSLMERHQTSKEHATELQNSVAEAQEAKLGIILRRLMERTEDNPELVNSLNAFLDALEHRANFGDSEKPLGKGSQQDIAKFMEEATKALRWTVTGGNRPADLKVDFSEWEKK